jgi:hypothetical protein
VLIALSTPIVIDTAGNVFLLWMTNEWVRLLTGVLWGSILPFFLIPGMMDMSFLLTERYHNQEKSCVFGGHIDQIQKEAK